MRKSAQELSQAHSSLDNFMMSLPELFDLTQLKLLENINKYIWSKPVKNIYM
jgi:hypothetical protein